MKVVYKTKSKKRYSTLLNQRTVSPNESAYVPICLAQLVCMFNVSIKYDISCIDFEAEKSYD